MLVWLVGGGVVSASSCGWLIYLDQEFPPQFLSSLFFSTIPATIHCWLHWSGVFIQQEAGRYHFQWGGTQSDLPVSIIDHFFPPVWPMNATCVLTAQCQWELADNMKWQIIKPVNLSGKYKETETVNKQEWRVKKQDIQILGNQEIGNRLVHKLLTR